VFYCWRETKCLLLSNNTTKFARILVFSKKKTLWDGHVAHIKETTAHRMMVGGKNIKKDVL
jgi:hypothetical protein